MKLFLLKWFVTKHLQQKGDEEKKIHYFQFIKNSQILCKKKKFDIS